VLVCCLGLGTGEGGETDIFNLEECVYCRVGPNERIVGGLYDYDNSLMWSGRYHLGCWFEDDSIILVRGAYWYGDNGICIRKRLGE
jgi:hypothetical protein